MRHRMPFGIFLAPFHKPGIHPTLALAQGLERVQWLDRCGHDEAWCGEHHSAGTEVSASPDIFMAAASQRARHIRRGSGVTSASDHDPLGIAERTVQRDHLTRGRVMLGPGPDSLPLHGTMVGLSQTETQTRPLLEEGLHVIVRLLTSSEPVTFRNDRWDLRAARLHLRASTCAPAATRWSASPCRRWSRPPAACWRTSTASACCRSVPSNNVKEMISSVNDSGFGAIGTPDMVSARIDRLWQQRNGGLGADLIPRPRRLARAGRRPQPGGGSRVAAPRRRDGLPRAPSPRPRVQPRPRQAGDSGIAIIG